MLASPKKMEKEKASKDDPKPISILEKQRASYRDQLEQAAKAAAKDFVEKARPERRPSIAKKPASKQVQKAGSKKNLQLREIKKEKKKKKNKEKKKKKQKQKQQQQQQKAQGLKEGQQPEQAKKEWKQQKA